MSANNLEDVENALADEIEEPSQDTTPPPDIVVLNEQRSCADILRLSKKDHIEINPEFQRDEVWPNALKTRFVDSMTKEMPIPSMCFGFDYKTDKRIVIDGLQRISTIIKFLDDEDWRLSSLNDINRELSGKTVKEIKNSNSPLYSRVENLTLPITVLRCDFSREDHMEYIYNIFYRLNTGGQKLNAQEIRNCIYIGNFNRLLSELREDYHFVDLLKLDPDSNYRLRWQELILRFFAFYDEYAEYSGRLSSFLNDYMRKNRILEDQNIDKKRALFKSTIKWLYDNKEIIEIPSSKTVLEALLIGIAKNLESLKNYSQLEISSRISNFKKEIAQSKELLENTSQRIKVIERIESSIRIFK